MRRRNTRYESERPVETTTPFFGLMYLRAYNIRREQLTDQLLGAPLPDDSSDSAP